MKPTAQTLMTAALIAALFGLAACAPRPPPPTVETTVIETPTGAEVVETIQLTATVVGINYDTRQIVLLGPGGREVTYKVDKNAVNFGQIKVRDQVKATVTEKLAVFLNKDKAPASAGTAPGCSGAQGRDARWCRRRHLGSDRDRHRGGCQSAQGYPAVR